MKRLIILAVLLIGFLLPEHFMPGDAVGEEWVMSAQAKRKTPKKTRKKSRIRQTRSRKRRQSDAGTATATLPLIGTSSLMSTQPGNALLSVDTPRGMNNQTVNYRAITIYFNSKLRIPNCVAYELTNTMVAMSDAPDAEKRKHHNFNADNRVAGCPGPNDYKGSGYTRGHMAPAMDMRWNRQAMTDCFLMTNMCPQDGKLNNGGWKDLEENVHRWAKRDGSLVVLTGPIVATAPRSAIGPKRDIAVPRAFYKVVYAPRQQRAIAFIYDNCPPTGGVKSHAVTIDEVERRTGLDFFTALGDDTERRIEAQCDYSQWR
ncbi:MAG: DNA/RNA non-specific endonuclease [Muribaculaceae bacterium]|nr:DNA/RNA non-specific endonuclease [Muribaculaceae bacterium]